MQPFVNQAKQEGYSDDEIVNFISQRDEKQKNFIDQATKEGYSSSDILNYMSPQEQKEEMSLPSKLALGAAESTLRVPAQYMLGAVEAHPIVFGAEMAGRGAQALQETEASQMVGTRENIASEIEHLVQKKQFNPGNWTEQDEERLNRMYEIGSMSADQMKEAGLFVKSPVKLAPSTIIEKIPGQEPRNIVEKTARLTGMLRQVNPATAMQFGKEAGSLLSKYLSAPVAKVLEKDVIPHLPLAATAVAGEEQLGIPEFVTLLSGAGASYAWNKIKQLGSWIGSRNFLFDPSKVNPYKPVESWKAEAGNAKAHAEKQMKDGLISPEQFEQVSPYLDVAEKYGLPIPYSAVTDSQFFKNVEKQIAENGLTEAAAQQFRQNAAKKWGESLETVLKDMRQNIVYSEPGGVADALLSDITRKKHQTMKEQYTKLYEEAASDLASSKNISPESAKEIEDSLTRVYNKVGEPVVPSQAEVSVKEKAAQSRRELTQSPREAGRPELAELEFPTGQELRTLEEQQAGQHLQERKGYWAKERAKGKIKEAAKRQQLTQEESQQKLFELFGEDAKNMRLENGKIRLIKPMNGKTMVESIRSLNARLEYDHPDVINMFMDTKKTFQNILEKEYGVSHKKALDTQKQGNQIFGHSQRLFGENAKWKKWGIGKDVLPEDLLKTINTVDRLKRFEKDFPEAKDLISYYKRLKVEEKLSPIFHARNYDPGNISSGIDKLMRDPMFKYMVPDQVSNNLKQLANLDAHLERTSSQFFKGKPPTPQQITFWGDVKHFLTLAPAKLADKVSKNALSTTYAEIMLNPNFTSEVKKIGTEAVSALKSGNPQKISKVQAEMNLLGEQLYSTGTILGVEEMSPGF